MASEKTFNVQNKKNDCLGTCYVETVVWDRGMGSSCD